MRDDATAGKSLALLAGVTAPPLEPGTVAADSEEAHMRTLAAVALLPASPLPGGAG